MKISWLQIHMRPNFSPISNVKILKECFSNKYSMAWKDTRGSWRHLTILFSKWTQPWLIAKMTPLYSQSLHISYVLDSISCHLLSLKKSSSAKIWSKCTFSLDLSLISKLSKKKSLMHGQNIWKDLICNKNYFLNWHKENKNVMN